MQSTSNEASIEDRFLAGHIRAMLRALHSLGMPETEKRPDCWVLSEELSKQGSLILYQAWTCESLLYALREIELEERCHWRVVLRCYGQAKLYVGRTHEMVASCYVNDAMFAVGEALAERLNYSIAAEEIGESYTPGV